MYSIRYPTLFLTTACAIALLCGSHSAQGMSYVSRLYPLTEQLSPFITSTILNRTCITSAAGALVAYTLGYKKFATLCGMGSLAARYIASHMKNIATTTATPSKSPATTQNNNSHRGVSRGYARLIALKDQLLPKKHARQTTSQVYLQLFQPPLEKYICTRDIDKIQYSDEFPLWSILKREMEFTLPPEIPSGDQGNYHVFYHAHAGSHRIAQDVMIHIYNFEQQTTFSDFIPLRFWHRASLEKSDAMAYITRKNILTCLQNDSQPSISAELLSANISLFGNLTQPNSCTLHFYLTSSSYYHQVNIAHILGPVFAFYGFESKYLQELIALSKEPLAQQGRMLQIFIPKKHIDTTVYLARSKGYPYDTNLLSKGFGTVIGENGETYAIQKRISPILDALQDGSFLKKFHNTSKDTIEQIISGLQARILLAKDVMLNPYSGVKIFAIDDASQEERAGYHTKIATIIHKALIHWLGQVRDNKISDVVLNRIKETPLGKLIHNRNKTVINSLIKKLQNQGI